MYLLNKPRGGGKTYEIIKDSSKIGVPILAANANHANYIKEKAKEMNVNIQDPISIHQLINDKSGSINNKKFLIDELTWCLESLLGVEVVGATDTTNVIQENNNIYSKYNLYENGILFR